MTGKGVNKGVITEVVVVAYFDSSLRLWDVNNTKKQLHVIKGRNKQGIVI